MNEETLRCAQGDKYMSFKDIIGQDKVISFLKQCLSAGRLSPALVFAGPPGVGKRRTARELAKTLNCEKLRLPPHLNPLPHGGEDRKVGDMESCDECVSCHKIDQQTHPDVMEMDLARQAEWLREKVERQTAIKIEFVRLIERQASLKPSEGVFKVVIMDPAQDLTEEAANALLKLLEEPPPQFQMILVVEDETALLATIRSRCTLVRFGRIPVQEITRHLAEHLNLPPEEAEMLAGRSDGSLGRAQWEKEWSGWETPALEEMGLPAAFQWLEQFDTRQGGRSAAQILTGILIRREHAYLIQGRPNAQERLLALLAASAALKQNVSPRLALEALYLRLRRCEHSPGLLLAASTASAEDD